MIAGASFKNYKETTVPIDKDFILMIHNLSGIRK